MMLSILLAAFIIMSFCVVSFMVIDQYALRRLLEEEEVDDQ